MTRNVQDVVQVAGARSGGGGEGRPAACVACKINKAFP